MPLALSVPAAVDVVPEAELPVAATSPVSLDGDLDLSLAQVLSGPSGSSSVPVAQTIGVGVSAQKANVTFQEAPCYVSAPSRVGESDAPLLEQVAERLENLKSSQHWNLCPVKLLGNARRSFWSLLGQNDDCGQRRHRDVNSSNLRVIFCLVV